MDFKALVAEVRNYVMAAQKERGPFWLVMLTREPEAPTKGFTLLLSAPWIDQVGHREALGLIAEDMKKALSPEAQSLIEQLAAAKTSDPFVRMMGKFQPGPQQVIDLVQSTVEGYYFDRAVIIISNVPTDHPTVNQP